MKREWISVKKRRPKPLKKVLCFYEKGGIMIDYCDFKGDFSYTRLYGTVTHWMPLPENPEMPEQSK